MDQLPPTSVDGDNERGRSDIRLDRPNSIGWRARLVGARHPEGMLGSLGPPAQLARAWPPVGG